MPAILATPWSEIRDRLSGMSTVVQKPVRAKKLSIKESQLHLGQHRVTDEYIKELCHLLKQNYAQIIKQPLENQKTILNNFIAQHKINLTSFQYIINSKTISSFSGFHKAIPIKELLSVCDDINKGSEYSMVNCSFDNNYVCFYYTANNKKLDNDEALGFVLFMSPTGKYESWMRFYLHTKVEGLMFLRGKEFFNYSGNFKKDFSNAMAHIDGNINAIAHRWAQQRKKKMSFLELENNILKPLIQQRLIGANDVTSIKNNIIAYSGQYLADNDKDIIKSDLDRRSTEKSEIKCQLWVVVYGCIKTLTSHNFIAKVTVQKFLGDLLGREIVNLYRETVTALHRLL